MPQKPLASDGCSVGDCRELAGEDTVLGEEREEKTPPLYYTQGMSDHFVRHRSPFPPHPMYDIAKACTLLAQLLPLSCARGDSLM